MKIKIINKDGKKETVKIDFFSILKLWFAGFFSYLGIVLGLGIILIILGEAL